MNEHKYLGKWVRWKKCYVMHMKHKLFLKKIKVQLYKAIQRYIETSHNLKSLLCTHVLNTVEK